MSIKFPKSYPNLAAYSYVHACIAHSHIHFQSYKVMLEDNFGSACWVMRFFFFSANIVCWEPLLSALRTKDFSLHVLRVDNILLCTLHTENFYCIYCTLKIFTLKIFNCAYCLLKIFIALTVHWEFWLRTLDVDIFHCTSCTLRIFIVHIAHWGFFCIFYALRVFFCTENFSCALCMLKIFIVHIACWDYLYPALHIENFSCAHYVLRIFVVHRVSLYYR